MQRVGFHAHEVHVGAHDAEGLTGDITAVAKYHNFAFKSLAPGEFLGETMLGNLTDKRYGGHVLNVLAALHASVKEEVEEQNGEGQTDCQCHVAGHHRLEDG